MRSAEIPLDRKCDSCNFCLRLDPTARDIKEGRVDSFLYCCHARGAVAIGKEVVPQLADIVRSNPRQCGPQAIWWQAAIGDLPSGATVSGVSVERRPGVEDNRTRGVIRTPYLRPARAKTPREPYKLEGVTTKWAPT